MNPEVDQFAHISIGDGLNFRASLKLTPSGHWHLLKYLKEVKTSDRASEILNLAEVGIQSLIARSNSGAPCAVVEHETVHLQVREATQLAKPAPSLSPEKVKSAFSLPKSMS